MRRVPCPSDNTNTRDVCAPIGYSFFVLAVRHEPLNLNLPHRMGCPIGNTTCLQDVRRNRWLLLFHIYLVYGAELTLERINL